MECDSTMKKTRKNNKTQNVVEGNEAWIFIDNKCQIDRKISLQWN